MRFTLTIDFAIVLQKPGLIAGLVVGFLALKALVLWTMVRAMDLSVFNILLAQATRRGSICFAPPVPPACWCWQLTT